MKAKEVRKILGVTQQTLYNYTKSGKLKFVKLSPTHSDYDEADVMALIGRKETYRDKAVI